MQVQRQSNGQMITLNTELGGGGEGKIYSISEEPLLVAKVYHQSAKVYTDKLSVMFANPPDDSALAQGRVSIAWPVDLLKDTSSQQIIGFLMQRVTEVRPIHDFYIPATRRDRSPYFNYLYLHRTARNLAAAVSALHAKGYVIGDVNESNILVTETALVTLVDTDSFQVFDLPHHKVYRCPVGKPEFTPPELQGKTFRDIDRTPEHDLFGLAVVIFQLLMEGTHPFDGVFQGSGDPPPKEKRILEGHFPYGNRIVPYRSKPLAPPFEILHPTLRQLFIRCFEDGHNDPKARPDAKTWVKALVEAENTLVTCSVNDQHRYGGHLNVCPWCERTMQLRGRDPFPFNPLVQQPLPKPGQLQLSIDQTSIEQQWLQYIQSHLSDISKLSQQLILTKQQSLQYIQSHLSQIPKVSQQQLILIKQQWLQYMQNHLLQIPKPNQQQLIFSLKKTLPQYPLTKLISQFNTLSTKQILGGSAVLALGLIGLAANQIHTLLIAPSDISVSPSIPTGDENGKKDFEWKYSSSELEQAQGLAKQRELQDAILEQAKALAREGNIQDGIRVAQQIRPGEELYETAQSAINRWNSVLYLEQAEALVKQGNFQDAVRVAQQIRPDQGLYETAQSAINRWQFKSYDLGVTLKILSVRRHLDSLLLNVSLKNESFQSVKFIDTFLFSVTDNWGRHLSASVEGLPEEFPPNGQGITGVVKIPISVLGSSEHLSLTWANYSDQRIRLQVSGIPVVK
ncbi:helix-hairpin-helix domain-containing protein [Argonema antarcticum]|uniref:helix-hairpin-helix domain-containing protein n=1 Tax=Argonema antarcticum TaxID=2942763 RepID=UPI00201313B8|nr:hypothetical protein [Argonema antarcticum]MCL1470452.1 hypothetical protein [Argonema antarcticum A004/B2]